MPSGLLKLQSHDGKGGKRVTVLSSLLYSKVHFTRKGGLFRATEQGGVGAQHCYQGPGDSVSLAWVKTSRGMAIAVPEAAAWEGGNSTVTEAVGLLWSGVTSSALFGVVRSHF
jgi:hypothetical protein